MSYRRAWDGADLSVAASIIWGKSGADPSTWLPLWRHLADAAGVADLLWRHWVPQRAKDLITTSLGLTDDEARRLIGWLAGIHDIGKTTPSFAVMQPELAARGRAQGLSVRSKRDRYHDFAHHTVTGQLILEEWLRELIGDTDSVEQLGCVVGGHHGLPPPRGVIDDVELRDRGAIFGDGDTAWAQVQTEILDWSADSADVRPILVALGSADIPATVQVLMTAIVIMADWIASDERSFPYRGVDPVNDTDRITHGWNNVELPPRWTATNVPSEVMDLYKLRFEIEKPYPLQMEAARIAASLTGPSMVIVEGPMGEGKTEAALAMAEIVAQRTGEGGVVIALPTQATSNAILRRFTRWLAKLPRAADVVFDVGLAHGKAGQNRHYRRLRSAGYRCMNVDSDRSRPTMAAHHWLAGRKRVMLSQFVIGTIDQILFAALKARHIALRHLGLAGKVVIIDEAHAYDIYMSRYLTRVIEWLGDYGCTVIVLSATLPADKRAELISAYQGRPVIEADDDLQYPLITTATRSGDPVRHPVETSQRHTEVAIEYLDEPEGGEFEPLVKLLDDALADGGCALIVRNTVTRAMATADVLRSRFGAEVTLAHSRYIAPDRVVKDDALVAEFGRDRVMDGRRRIIVSTQVCEQSLDLDFDLLVTDLAPMDLMLQRMGRMHRHDHGEGQSQRPERLRSARCVIAGAQWSGDMPVPVPGSTRVYHGFQLLRAAAALNDRQSIQLPDDIPHLVEAAYGEDQIGPVHWLDELDRLRERFLRSQETKENRARSFLLDTAGKQLTLSGWIDAGVGDNDDTLAGYQQVRDSVDSLEVLVLVERDGQWFTPWWIQENPDCEVSRGFEPDAVIARTAASCSISLPFWLDYDTLVADLEPMSDIMAWRSCHWLEGQLVLPLDAETLSATVGRYRFHYDLEQGLTVREVERD